MRGVRWGLLGVVALAACGGAAVDPAIDIPAPTAPAPRVAEIPAGRLEVLEVVWGPEHVLLRTRHHVRVFVRGDGRPVGPWIGVETEGELLLDTTGLAFTVSAPEGGSAWSARLVAAADGAVLGRWPGESVALPVGGTVVIARDLDGPHRVTVRDGRSGRLLRFDPPEPGASYHRPPRELGAAPHAVTPDGRLVALTWSSGVQLVDLERGGAVTTLAGGHVAVAPPRWVAIARDSAIALVDGRASGPPTVFRDPRCVGGELVVGSPREGAFVLAHDPRTLCLLDARRGELRWVHELEEVLPGRGAEASFLSLGWGAEGLVVHVLAVGVHDGAFDVRTGARLATDELPPAFLFVHGALDPVQGSPLRLRPGDEVLSVVPDGGAALVVAAGEAPWLQDPAGRRTALVLDAPPPGGPGGDGRGGR